MFDILTAIVLLLSGIFEGYKLFQAVNSLALYNKAMSNASQNQTLLYQLEVIKNNSIFEIIVCSILLVLTIICLIRFIRLAIIGNIVYLAHNTTKDFLQTTNSSRSSESSASSSYGYTGGMKITNSNNKKE